MQQSTAVFSNAAARTAAITSPVEGQLTYLEDTNLYASWNGSAWVSPFGETLIGANSFAATTAVSIDNIFTSEFDFYRIVCTFVADSSAVNVSLRLRLGGVDTAGSGYTFNFLRNTGTSVGGTQNTAASGWRVGVARTTHTSFTSITLANPFKSGSRKNYLFHEFNQDGSTTETNVGGGYNPITTAHDGFKFYAESANNLTGSLKVYGLRN
jgi:hypothetical protein